MNAQLKSKGIAHIEMLLARGNLDARAKRLLEAQLAFLKGQSATIRGHYFRPTQLDSIDLDKGEIRPDILHDLGQPEQVLEGLAQGQAQEKSGQEGDFEKSEDEGVLERENGGKKKKKRKKRAGDKLANFLNPSSKADTD